MNCSYTLNILINLFVSFIVVNSFEKQLKLPELLRKLFQHQQCIYLVLYQETYKNLIENVFETLPIFIIHNSTFNPNVVPNEYNCEETGYIVIINDKSDISYINLQMFLPQQRIVFIHSPCIKTQLYKAVNEGLFRSVDIILISISVSRNFELLTITNNTNAKLMINEVFWYNKNITINETNLNNTQETKVKLLFKKPVQLLLFHQFPFVVITNSTYSGLEIEILKLITKHWPLEFVEYGLFAWNKMLADLLNDTGDLSITAHWQSEVMNYELNFVPYMELSSTFLVPDAHLLPRVTYFFQPLSNNT